MEYIAQAFGALEQGADVVLGPSDDRGYYLIGLTHTQPRLLREAPMSMPTVLYDTLTIAAELDLEVALLRQYGELD